MAPYPCRLLGRFPDVNLCAHQTNLGPLMAALNQRGTGVEVLNASFELRTNALLPK
jgi:hypothetical protein